MTIIIVRIMTISKFEIIYDSEVKNHLKFIDKKYWKLIKETIANQLSHQPDVETKNRKPLSKPPVDNKWEIRFGPNNCFRVFYNVFKKEKEVWILAVGKKFREKIIIGGKVIEL